MTEHPDADDYLRLFGAVRERDCADLAPGGDGERFSLLFEQVCRMLARASRFNLAMPPELRRAAARWLSGDAEAIAQLSDPQRRHLMLSDVHDYAHLRKALSAARG